MAELALGAISLGIQVCEGISTYVSAISSRDEDIESVRRQSQDLENIIHSIDSLIDHNDFTHTLSSPGVLRCLQTCDTDMKALDKLGRELVGRPLSSVSSLREKAKEGFKLFSYPYSRSKMITLRDQLGRSLTSLQMMSQYFDL